MTNDELITILAAAARFPGSDLVPLPFIQVVTWLSYPYVHYSTALAFAERLTTLNQETARSTLEDSVSGAKAVLGAKDAKEVLSIQASLSQAAVERALAYSRSVHEIAAQTQEELTKRVQAHLKSLAYMNEQSASAAANNSAFGIMRAVAKRFSDVTQANIAAMTKVATAAAR